MKNFATLYTLLDQTNKTNAKVELLVRYFNAASDEDKLWTLTLLSGRSLKRSINSTRLAEYCCDYANLPWWLFEESYAITGDLAETITHLLPLSTESEEQPLSYWIRFLQALDKVSEELKKESILQAWAALTPPERFAFNKLITGGFRIGISQKLVVRALSIYTGIHADKLAHRLMGNWHPDDVDFNSLISEEKLAETISTPYPFYLSYALEAEPSELGNIEDWQAEWKWDGIRGQIIKRKGEIFVWSRGEDLITERFPEYLMLRNALPDGTVLDGEILPYREGKPLSFQLLQTRIGRKTLTKKILADAPVVFMVYDLLEWEGVDWRTQPLEKRRAKLEQVVAEIGMPELLMPSPKVEVESWERLAQERQRSRDLNSEGIMLKRRDSIYEVGRKKGSWWKWKLDPYSIDAVMIYAQAGHGRRANLYTDYTFAVWHNGELVPFAKAYSGLTDDEIREVDRFVKKNTIEKFGPVRRVTPQLVFEIGFEGINYSPRHKSGVALRFPRILRWRKDKPIEEANTLDDLKIHLVQ